MNGADALISTLVANEVTACFANTGTSEMQFVAALDGVPAMSPVLCQLAGLPTGAAGSPDPAGRGAAGAVSASYGPPGGPVALILPADSAWFPAKDEPVIAQ